MSKLKEFIIYVITDVITGKSYVGCTVKEARRRINDIRSAAIRGENTKFKRHIRSVLGTSFTTDEFMERFKWKELQRTTNEAVAEFYEHNYIGFYNSYWDGYNATMDGKSAPAFNKFALGYRHTEETKKKMSLLHKGNTYGKSNKGKKRGSPTMETRRKIAATLKGKTKGSKHPRWVDVDVEKIKELRGEGISMTAIGIQLGVSLDVVRSRLGL